MVVTTKRQLKNITKLKNLLNEFGYDINLLSEASNTQQRIQKLEEENIKLEKKIKELDKKVKEFEKKIVEFESHVFKESKQDVIETDAFEQYFNDIEVIK